MTPSNANTSGLEVERKAELYDHMKLVAEANGFKSLTEAIARATANEARADRYYDALVQADLTIRAFPGTDQSDVEFIHAALQQEG